MILFGALGALGALICAAFLASRSRRPCWRLYYAKTVAEVHEALAAGENINQRGVGDVTPLLHATVCRRVEVACALIKAGADVNAANCVGRTSLHNATEFGLNKVVRALLAAGANVNAKASFFQQQTPLFLADDLEVLRLLLAAGANVEAVCYRRTPLMWFVQAQRWEVAKELVQHGAAVTDPQLLFTVVDSA